ncbi:mixed lineage kinase domain-like protein [Rana temporaria]|uniref:mixed lineage kinase domain-like protein n=1 Tax=Rana temporaria TaxID=8407 RepID=UPI001AADC3CC|nr:mixed lineage kinase domain-like protein [Rana temporaria]
MVLSQVLAVAKTIYQLCDKAGSNKKQCRRLENRLRMLLLPLMTLDMRSDKSVALQAVVEELDTLLKNARDWVIKYSHHSWWKRVLKANSIKEEFGLINDRLGESATHISLLLDAEQRYMLAQHKEILIQQKEMISQQMNMLSQFFSENTRKKENREDLEEDLKALRTSLNSKVILESGMKSLEIKRCLLCKDKPSDPLWEEETSDLRVKLSQISIACLRPNWNITEIPVKDLERGDLLLERATHYLYRGELQNTPVAIKVFKDQNVQTEFIRRTFQTESQTMKKFECLNILQLYGICIANSGPHTRYSLVMELCEKGTLRELLQTELDLKWDQKVLMALDAAKALYRLHQTEEKAILCGNLSSSKYLVDGMYCVKLSGFGLSKTESSIRRPSNMERRKARQLEYIAPETWQDINAYDKRSEVYSLGVVMYEIATGKPAFHNLEVTEDKPGEMREKWWSSLHDELPSSCPDMFRDLIGRLIQKNPNNRPSAGVTVDLLMALWNQKMCPDQEFRSARASLESANAH